MKRDKRNKQLIKITIKKDKKNDYMLSNLGLKNSQFKISYIFSYLGAQKKTLSKNRKVPETLIYKGY